MNAKRCALFCVVGIFTTAASAGVAPTGPFTGSLFEGWNDKGGVAASFSMFGDGSSITSNGGGAALLATPSWSFFTLISAYEGGVMMGDTGGGGYTFNFASPLSAFGAYFGTNSNLAGGTAEIYNPAGALLGSFPVQAPEGDWAWDGWATTGGDSIGSVKIIPANAFGGFVMNDAATGNPIPAPGAIALAMGGACLALRRRR
ncbi:MAG TPA: hypothetical protein VK176_12835 [Phycisphaerales bacterium]|nr:hypothetical protein [Phycisphaerales bacterium]